MTVQLDGEQQNYRQDNLISWGDRLLPYCVDIMQHNYIIKNHVT